MDMTQLPFIMDGLLEREKWIIPNPLGDSYMQDVMQQRAVWSYMRLFGAEGMTRLDPSTANRIYGITRGSRVFQGTVNQQQADSANTANKGNGSGGAVPPPFPPPGMPIYHPRPPTNPGGATTSG
jgi:hypothetical protein